MTEERAATPGPRGNHRVRVGFLTALVVFILALAGGWFWIAFVVAMFYVSFQELQGLMAAKDIRPSKIITLTVGLLLIMLAAAQKTSYFPSVITLGIILSFFRLLFRQPRASISDIGATLLAIFYVAYLPVHYILLRNIGASEQPNPLLQPGLGYMVFTILVISVSDIVAYYVGRRFGKHLLYPEISPKKTREGAAGGAIAGLLAGLVFAQVIHFPLPHAFVLSSLLIVVGQLGDLSESLLKRDAGIKDSGALLQGHGGVLDRADSYIFSGAVSYYYIQWAVLQQGLAQDVLRFLKSLG